MEALYEIAGIKRQVYFASLKGQKRDTFIELRTIEIVKQIRLRHPSMGARSLYYLLQPKWVGINKFEQLISESGLGIKRKKNWIKTTNSNHPYRKYGNLTNGLIINDINCLWATDITYWLESDRIYYLIFLMDVYSRRVIGHIASENMYAISTLKVLNMAFLLRKQNYFQSLIHHSDKGSQYCATLYIKTLEKANISISMAGTSLENSYAERLNGIIKNDYLKHFDTSNYQKLNKSLKQAVWLYNNERPHSELEYMTPVEYEKQLEKRRSEERFLMKLYDFNKDK